MFSFCSDVSNLSPCMGPSPVAISNTTALGLYSLGTMRGTHIRNVNVNKAPSSTYYKCFQANSGLCAQILNGLKTATVEQTVTTANPWISN
uniref:Uncharacterized protein n=1 Tax=Anguilla anguilla TaxID=7936 RepID=A0A0E9WYK1_ANGAN